MRNMFLFRGQVAASRGTESVWGSDMGGGIGVSYLARIAALLAVCLLIVVATACSPAAAPDDADATPEPTVEAGADHRVHP